MIFYFYSPSQPSFPAASDCIVTILGVDKFPDETVTETAMVNVLGELAMTKHRHRIKAFIGQQVRTIRWAWKDSLRKVSHFSNAF